MYDFKEAVCEVVRKSIIVVSAELFTFKKSDLFLAPNVSAR